ncbi:hypothetical protein B0H11DRAFT_1922325 [Mycena galericulata]|nr:hypothetical protein B0H11DRAFT_1922325 [Mycena galericulata]
MAESGGKARGRVVWVTWKGEVDCVLEGRGLDRCKGGKRLGGRRGTGTEEVREAEEGREGEGKRGAEAEDMVAEGKRRRDQLAINLPTHVVNAHGPRTCVSAGSGNYDTSPRRPLALANIWPNFSWTTVAAAAADTPLWPIDTKCDLHLHACAASSSCTREQP